MKKSPDNSPAVGRLLPFLAIQLLVVGAATAGLTYRSFQLEERYELPRLREVPLEVAPQYDEPLMVTDEQLRRVLRKLRPRLQGTQTRIGHVDHNLRFWGAQAQFDDPQFVSGEDLRRLLTDHRYFETLYGDEAEEKPLLIEVEEDDGVRVREFQGKMSASHDDHTMACLAEVGTPLDYPIRTLQREATFRDIVEQSLRDFSLNQPEYEWSSLTYALFVKDHQWITGEGQRVSFDLLADRIMRQEMPQGVCMGNHRLHSLVMLLRVDEMWDGPTELLTDEARRRIVAFLSEMTRKLVAHQHPDGFWNVDWPTATPASREPTRRDGDELSDRIIATGHALEWWALVPNQYSASVLPDREVRVRAAQWLVRTIDEMSAQDVVANNSFLSHSGRALALWRGKYPYQFELGGPEDQRAAADPPPQGAETREHAPEGAEGNASATEDDANP